MASPSFSSSKWSWGIVVGQHEKFALLATKVSESVGSSPGGGGSIYNKYEYAFTALSISTNDLATSPAPFPRLSSPHKQTTQHNSSSVG